MVQQHDSGGRRSLFGLPSGVPLDFRSCLHAALAGIEQAQRWFSGLEFVI
jgi:hypothetical protein